MTSWFEKNRTLTLVIVNIASISILIFIVELLLRSFYPAPIATFGLPSTHNGSLYGWGFDPKQLIKISDPDSGAVYIDLTNSHGWRDLDREYENKKQAYRILVLGDSHTFGLIVPAEKIYTRLLEKKFRDAGYNVEIISLALSSWGTDQELEALVNEGLLYKPNLIILQFSTNDLGDNAYFYLSTRPGTKIPEQMKGYKPFYYEVTDSDELVKRENSYFHRSWTWRFLMSSDFIKLCINNSEILKRLYQFIRYHSPSDTVYKVGKNQLDQLQFVLNLDESSDPYKCLHKRLGSEITSEDLNSCLNAADDQTKRTVFRVLEDRLLHEYWSRERYNPKRMDTNSYEWRLFSALVKKIKFLADTIHADFVIFPATDEEEFRWHVSWYRYPDTEEAKENFLSPIQTIRDTLPTMGINVVNNTVTYDRARNDPHVTVEGNEAMAEDLHKYLMTHYESTFRNYREAGAIPHPKN